jgi:hypothetical protein
VLRRCGSGRPCRPGRLVAPCRHDLFLAQIRLCGGGDHLAEGRCLFRYVGPCRRAEGRRLFRYVNPCRRVDRRFVYPRAYRTVGEAPRRLIALIPCLMGVDGGEADGPRRLCQNPCTGRTHGIGPMRWCFRQLRHEVYRSYDGGAWEDARDRSRTRPFAPRAVQTSSPRKEMLSVWRVYLGCLGLPPAIPTEKRGRRAPVELGSAPKGFQSMRERLARGE